MAFVEGDFCVDFKDKNQKPFIITLFKNRNSQFSVIFIEKFSRPSKKLVVFRIVQIVRLELEVQVNAQQTEQLFSKVSTRQCLADQDWLLFFAVFLAASNVGIQRKRKQFFDNFPISFQICRQYRPASRVSVGRSNRFCHVQTALRKLKPSKAICRWKTLKFFFVCVVYSNRSTLFPVCFRFCLFSWISSGRHTLYGVGVCHTPSVGLG